MTPSPALGRTDEANAPTKLPVEPRCPIPSKLPESAGRYQAGNRIRIEHDPTTGRLARILDTAERELRFGYEGRGFVCRIELWASEPVPPLLPGAPAPAPTPPALRQWVDYAYRPSEELASVTSALGHAEHFEYDAFHRMVRTTLRNGVSFQYAYDEDSGRCIRTWGPDGLHLVELEFDDDKHTTLVHGTAEIRVYEHNAAGLVTRERTHDGLIDRARAFDADRSLVAPG